VQACANCRERAVPRRARWCSLAGFGFAKSQFRHGFPRKGHGRQAAHPENYFGKTGMVAVPLQNFAAVEKLSTQIRQICGYKTSIDAKFYRFVSGFAITLRGGLGSFRKFLVIRNVRICGASVEMLVLLVTIIKSHVCYEITTSHTFTFYCRRWKLRVGSMSRLYFKRYKSPTKSLAPLDASPFQDPSQSPACVHARSAG
jgi:hypothetical protein